MPYPPLARYLDVAVRAAQQAGILIASRAGHPRRVTTKSHPIDLVTEVDRASERILHDAIVRRCPELGFQGEEKTLTNPDAPYRWVVDPIDGTTNFVHGMPFFAISMGLVRHDEPVAGLVYDPMRKEMFTAVTRGGAFLNGTRIRVSRTDTMGASLLSTGFSPKFRDEPRHYLRWLEAFQFNSHAVRRLGSTSLCLAYMAAGRQDGFYEQELWPWDIAAGIVLVREAGGRVTDFDGRPATIADRKLVASNGRIHQEILDTLTASTPVEG